MFFVKMYTDIICALKLGILTTYIFYKVGIYKLDYILNFVYPTTKKKISKTLKFRTVSRISVSKTQGSI